MQFSFLSVFLDMAELMMVINVQHNQLQGVLIIGIEINYISSKQKSA